MQRLDSGALIFEVAAYNLRIVCKHILFYTFFLVSVPEFSHDISPMHSRSHIHSQRARPFFAGGIPI